MDGDAGGFGDGRGREWVWERGRNSGEDGEPEH